MTEVRQAGAAPGTEVELLLGCARVRLDPERAGRIQALSGRAIDWARLLRLARGHGTIPLLHRHLSATCPDVVPRAVLDRLRDQYHRNALHNLFLSSELLKLLKLFDAQGIAALPFKGPTLAAYAYGDLALRQFNDLDLLCPRADLPRARDLLMANGYLPPPRLTPAREAAYLHSICQLPFVSDASGCLVELHSDVTPRAFSFPLDPERLWQRRVAVSLNGHSVPGPAPEDLLLILCAHGAKHLWTCLGWVCDVAELVRAHPGMDWARVFRQAGVLHGERILRLGLSLADDLLGAALPADVRRRVRSDAVARALAAGVCRRLLHDAAGSPGGSESALFHFRARERLREGVGYSLSVAFTPTEADWAFVPLPPALSFLYYLLRPIRLAGKHARASWAALWPAKSAAGRG